MTDKNLLAALLTRRGVVFNVFQIGTWKVIPYLKRLFNFSLNILVEKSLYVFWYKLVGKRLVKMF